MEYPKINSLWKRHGWYFDEEKKKSSEYQNGRQSFIEGDYAQEEFAAINRWHIQEKIDGTNIRIFFDGTQVRFGGRTDNAQIPCHLLDYLQDTFTESNIQANFPDSTHVILFGEGYGPKIQAAGPNYAHEVGFILFDVRIGSWWLKREKVEGIGSQLGIKITPNLGIMTTQEAVDFVKSKPLSQCSVNPQMMEGIVARSEPLMLTRSGQPIMWKLKCREF